LIIIEKEVDPTHFRLPNYRSFLLRSSHSRGFILFTMSVSSLNHSRYLTTGSAWSLTASKNALVWLLLYVAGLYTHLLFASDSITIPAKHHVIHTAHRTYPFKDFLDAESNTSTRMAIIDRRISVPQTVWTYGSPKVYVSSIMAQYFTRELLREFAPYVAVLVACLAVLRHTAAFRKFKAFSTQNACLPIRIAPNPFPWKLRRYFELSKIDANLLDGYLLKKFEVNGLTHGFATVCTKKVKAVATIESENFKAVLATNFDDWERPKFRAGAARPFLKTGILTLVSGCATQLLLLPILATVFWLKVIFRLTMLF
jgi:hypothetical protein